MRVTVRFVDGSIIMTQRNLDTVRSIEFSTYNLIVDLHKMLPSDLHEKKEPKEMSLGALFRRTREGVMEEKKYNKAMMVMMERFSIPIAVFLMGIIGAPLGSQIRSRGRLIGIIVSLMVFLAYYLFFAGVRSLCETGTISPSFGMWIPDIFLLLACLMMLLKVGIQGVHIASSHFFPPLSKKWIVLFGDVADGRPLKTIIEMMRIKQNKPEENSQTDVAVFQKSALDEKCPTNARYIGNMSARKFHDASCKWAQRIFSNNRHCFSSKKEALEAGYSPCKICLK
jgi:hypothetical protein